MTDSNLSQQNMRGPSFMNISKENDDKHQHTEECNHTLDPNPTKLKNEREKLREKLKEKLAIKKRNRLNRLS